MTRPLDTIENREAGPLPRLEDPLPSLPDVPSGSVIDEFDEIESVEENDAVEIIEAVTRVTHVSPVPGETPFDSQIVGTVALPPHEPLLPPPIPQKRKTKRYSSSRPINSGGMGEIFLVRDERLHRDIAAKVLNARLGDDPRARERFTREVNIISTLQHPGIVTVYDCGRCHDGRPFYMMQFIDGRTLDQAIRDFHSTREPKPTPTERSVQFRKLLSMVIDVCNAVAYMHSQGYLHRDLKPANIMVGSYGETILIDMGLAKHFEDRREEHLQGSLADLGPELTHDGSILGTPEYMSPEQASGSVFELRETSDIYSLGAILYKVLTGSLAIHPSAEYHVTLAYVLQGKFDPPRKLVPSLPRDLEAITLKAMARDPQDRYQTATEMADDLRLWLADEPVTARRPGLVERAWRWAKRKRTLVVGVILFALTTIVLLSVGLVVVNQQKQEKETARQEAIRARLRVRESLDTLATTLLDGNQLESQKELLPEQKRFLETALADYREFASETADTLEGQRQVALAAYRVAYIQRRLGDYNAADTHFREAISRYRTLVEREPDHVDDRIGLARSLHYYAFLLSDRGRERESIELNQEVVALREKLMSEFPTRLDLKEELTRTLNNLGTTAHSRLPLEQARAFYDRTMKLQKELIAEKPGEIEFEAGLARTTLNYANVLADLQEADEAVRTIRDGIGRYQKLIPTNPLQSDFRADVARGQLLLGIQLSASDPDEAGKVFDAAIAELRSLVQQYPLTRSYRKMLGYALTQQFDYLLDRKRYPQAKTAILEAKAISEKLAGELPESDPRADLAATRLGLGRLFEATYQFELAETEMRAALEINRQLAEEPDAKPEYRRNRVGNHVNLGRVLHFGGKPAEAEEQLLLAATGFRQLEAEFPDRPSFGINLSWTLSNLFEVVLLQNRLAEALAINRERIEVAERLLLQYPRRAYLRYQLAASLCDDGRILSKLDRHAEAEKQLLRAIEIGEKLVAENPKVVLHVDEWMRARGLLVTELGYNGPRVAEAEKRLRELVADCETYARLQDRPLELRVRGCEYRQQLIEAMVFLKRLDDAERVYQEGLGYLRLLLIADPTPEPLRREQARLQHNYSVFLCNTVQKITEGIVSAREAIRQYQSLNTEFGNDAYYLNQIGRIQNNLGFVYQNLPEPNLSEAIVCFQEATRLRENLVRDDPRDSEVIFDYNRSLEKLAECQVLAKKLPEAEATWKRALLLWEQVGPTYRPNLAFAHIQLAAHYSLVGQHTQARAAIEKGIDIRDLLIREQPEATDVMSDQAAALVFLAEELQALARPATEIEPPLLKALAYREALAAKGIDVPAQREGQAQIHQSLGVLAASIHPRRVEKAEPSIRKALEIRLALQAEDPRESNRAVAVAETRIVLYDFLIRTRNEAAIKAFYLEALAAILADLKCFKEPPPLLVGKELLLRINAVLADLFASRERSHLKQCLATAEEIRSRVEPLLRAEKDSYELRNLKSASMELLGLLHTLLGNAEECGKAYDAAIEAAPGEELQLNLRQARIGGLVRAGGDRKELLREAEGIHQRFVERNSSDYNWCCVLALLAEATSKDTSLPEAERMREVEQFTRLALSNLKRLADRRFYDNYVNLFQLQRDYDWDYLRGNLEFQEFLRTLERGPWPMNVK